LPDPERTDPAKPTALICEHERVFRSLAQVACWAQQLQVRPVIRSAERQRLEVIDVIASPQAHGAYSAATTLERLEALDILSRVRPSSATLASPSSGIGGTPHIWHSLSVCRDAIPICRI
jgi:hypothetical protein